MAAHSCNRLPMAKVCPQAESIASLASRVPCSSGSTPRRRRPADLHTISRPARCGGRTVSDTDSTPDLDKVLRLRLVPKRKKKAVRWAEDVVDNELMNKRSSKQCCIFHKQRQFGDWDDNSDDEPCFNPDDGGQSPDGDPAAQS